MDEMMGVIELSKYLKVNPQTIYNWVSDNKVPYTKIGDLLRFKKSDIDEWFKKKTEYPDRVRYKEFEIEAAPYQLTELKKWKLNINIWKHKGYESVVRNFGASNTFDSKEEAIKHCFDFGIKIIDGKIENLTVMDM